MGRMNFGGAQDLSGVFASLQNQYENRVEADVANARARAAEEQAAEDREVHAKWMAGKISDEAWLAHLESRIDGALDAEEKSQYTEMLLEHRGAIQDAQMEARFAMGQVSIGALMKHYSKRMGAVEKESPAWRELASRYGQLTNAAQSGYGGGGGGGGRRGGSGGGSGSSGASAGDIVSAGLDVLQSGDMFKGIHTGGPDLVDPTVSMRPIEDDDDLINSLLTDIERIEQLEDWMDAHPKDTTVVDEATGEEFEVNGDFLTNLDKQYLRSQQALAAAYYARGTTEDDKKGTQALGYATKWVAGAMTRHNTLKAEPHVQMLEQFAFSEVVGASKITDPAERRRAYAATLGHVARFADKNGLVDKEPMAKTEISENRGIRAGQKRDEGTPDALRPDDDIYTRIQVLMGTLRIGAHSDRYSIDELNSMADEVLSQSASIGEGGATISITTLLNGPGEDGASDVPDDFIGLLETMSQVQGLEAGRRIMAGVPDPTYDGPIYTYQYDGERTRAVIADVRDQANAGGGVSPVIVPQGEDPEGLVLTRVRISGETRSVWVAPKPVDDPRFRVYRARNGELLTSKEIKDMGPARLQALVGQGEVEVDSVLTGVKMPDGRVWFRDNDTGMYHLEPPVQVTGDSVTGGVLVDEEREPLVNHVPFSSGVMTPFAGVKVEEMQRWTEQAVAMGLLNPTAFRRRGAGGDLVDIESVDGMYYTAPERGPRKPNLTLEDTLKTRQRLGEEDFERAGDPVTAIRQQQAEQQTAGERTRAAAERMGIQIGGIAAGRSKGTSAAQPPETMVPRAGVNYLEARENALAAMEARTKAPKRFFVPTGKRKVGPEPVQFAPTPVARAPLPLLRDDRPTTAPVSLAPKKKAPLPQYDPEETTSSNSGSASSKSGTKLGGGGGASVY